MKKTISLFVSFCILLSSAICINAQETVVETQIAKTASYLIQAVSEPCISTVGGEWLILGLARSGAEVPDGYFEKYYENVCRTLQEKEGILHSRKYTEYSRVVLALSAINKNPQDVCGYHLLTPLCDYEKTVWQGTNGAVFALLALDCKNYEMPICENILVQATRQKYVELILSRQNSDGGFSLASSGESDVDITSMSLTALAKYKDNATVFAAIERALSYLSSCQNADGGFFSLGEESAESCAQVLTALATLGIDTEDNRFVKNGNTVLSRLMSFAADDGSFFHVQGATSVDLMATEQALYALCTLQRQQDGQSSFYDMTNQTAFEQKIFDDIQNNRYNKEINALYERGIINGKSERRFEPSATMTRAEFATIVVRALGLSIAVCQIFEDVPQQHWSCAYVAAAYQNHIVTGISDTQFQPDGNITREEAAVMLARAAKLRGVRGCSDKWEEILTPFSDVSDASMWARDALAFCVQENILITEDGQLAPKIRVKRDEIAAMIYNLLSVTEG